jgi:diguanylate cyclase (GGDEF)-like protein/PAS domain S-box-containing protein
LNTAAPFHLVLDRHLRFQQAGPSAMRLFPELVLGASLDSIFDVASPKVPATFEAFSARPRSLFLLRGLREVTLRGQMLHQDDADVLIFIGTPWVTELAWLSAAGLTLNDFAVSDAVIDYLLLLQQQATSLAQAHELAAALSASEKRSRRILETSNDAFVEITPRGVITAWNPRAEQMFGWNAAEVLGRSFDDLLLDPEHRGEHRRRLAAALAGADSGLPVRARDVAARHKDGSRVPVEVALWTTPHEGQQSVNISFRDITEREAAERRAAEQASALRHQALHDPLTGLANRTLLHERLQQACDRRGRNVGVLLLDLDNFKSVNDVSGHAAGDQLLMEVARRLVSCVRSGDTVARLGGDEFAIVVKHDDPRQLAARILGQLAEPITIEGRQVVPLASIGIAVSEDTADVNQMLLQADVAMYAAKAGGKGRAEQFNATMAETIRLRADLHEALREAVSRGEIVVHYQPIIDVQAQTVSRVEALVRWQRPEELIAPYHFLPLAEETGLILGIGQEVLRQACQQLQTWLADDERRTVAVNFSALELAEPDLADRVTTTLAESNVRPGQLILEVTETLFLDATAALVERLGTLRRLGIRVSIDDFGTGYSSLGRLHALPIDSIKIDKSFVDLIDTGAEDLPIITSMILMAHALGLDVTAEGVETAAQAERLSSLGCDYLQGYHFARPHPVGAALGHVAEEAVGTWQRLGVSGISNPLVLLIEDDGVSRAVVRVALEHSGFALEEAESGAEGLARAVDLRPACVLVDLGLPDMDGLDVVRALRSQPELATTAVVVLTGAAHRKVKSRAFDAGADDYIVKPIVAAHLPAQLHGAIRAARRSATAAH